MNTEKTTRSFNYFYNGQDIGRAEFLSRVPQDWMSHLDEYGTYTWGYYTANERD